MKRNSLQDYQSSKCVKVHRLLGTVKVCRPIKFVAEEGQSRCFEFECLPELVQDMVFAKLSTCCDDRLRALSITSKALSLRGSAFSLRGVYWKTLNKHNIKRLEFLNSSNQSLHLCISVWQTLAEHTSVKLEVRDKRRLAEIARNYSNKVDLAIAPYYDLVIEVTNPSSGTSLTARLRFLRYGSEEVTVRLRNSYTVPTMEVLSESPFELTLLRRPPVLDK